VATDAAVATALCPAGTFHVQFEQCVEAKLMIDSNLYPLQEGGLATDAAVATALCPARTFHVQFEQCV